VVERFSVIWIRFNHAGQRGFAVPTERIGRKLAAILAADAAGWARFMWANEEEALASLKRITVRS
jgi:hypothetical protein